MAKPLPMPVELVAFHPAMQCLPGAAQHMTWSITLAFWLGECRGIPESSGDLTRMANTDAKGWQRHGSAVRNALAEIMPTLTKWRSYELEQLEMRRRKAAHARTFQNRQREPQLPHAAPSPPPEPAFRVAHKSTYKPDGRTDELARRQAMARTTTIRRNGMLDIERVGGIEANTAGKALPPTPNTLVSPAMWEFVPTADPPPGIVDAAD